MRTLLFTLFLTLSTLTACGGGSTPQLMSTAVAQSGAPFPQSVNPINCTTLNQPCLSVGRIISDPTGQPGNVANSLIVRTRVEPDVKNFEWTGLFIMDNFAKAGENVAVYGQGNAYNTGQTWGGVMEVVQRTTVPSSLVGLEVGMSTTIPENGNQLGVHAVINGSGGTAAFVADGGRAGWKSGFRAQGTVYTLIDAERTSGTNVLLKISSSGGMLAPPGGTWAGNIAIVIDGTRYYIPFYYR